MKLGQNKSRQDLEQNRTKQNKADRTWSKIDGTWKKKKKADRTWNKIQNKQKSKDLEQN